MIDALGWIGAVCFAVCGLPQLFQTWRTKNVKGISGWFLVLWFVGEVSTGIFVSTRTPEPALLFNYGFNFLVLVVLICLFWRYQ